MRVASDVSSSPIATAACYLSLLLSRRQNEILAPTAHFQAKDSAADSLNVRTDSQ